MPKTDSGLEDAIQEYVLSKVKLGIYDPTQPRRPSVKVASFEIELIEDDDAVIHVAGPITLETPEGEVECYVRLSLPFALTDSGFYVREDIPIRAAYIVETDGKTGACKETAALANC